MAATTEDYARSVAFAPTAERVAWLAMSALTLLAAAIRVFHLSFAPFWTDEYATYVFATEPLARLFGAAYRAETNPPLYYLLQRAWLWAGDTPAAMRMLPLACGVLTVPLTFLLGRRLVGDAAALIASALVATSALHIHYSREARGYTLLTAACLGALICLSQILLPRKALAADRDRAQRQPDWPRWMGYVGCSLVALYTHSTAILLPVLSTVVFAIWLFMRRVDRGLLRGWLVAHLTLALLLAPQLQVMLHQSTHQLTDFWVPSSTPGWVYSQLLGAYPFPKWSKPFFFALLALGAWMLRRRPDALACLGVFIVGQPLLLFVASLLRPMFLTRVLVWPTPLACLLIGYGLVSLRAYIGRVNLFMATVLACAFQLSAVRVEVADQAAAAPVAAFVEPLRDYRPQHDVLVFAPLDFAWSLWYEARGLALARDGVGVTYRDDALQLDGWYGARHVRRAEVVSQLGTAQRVWLVLERVPKFSHAPAEGFEQTVRDLRQWGETRETWHSGPLELLLIERR